MQEIQHQDKLDFIYKSNKEFIIGVDEVGAGSLAGQIYVCAFSAPKDWSLKGLTDSKALSPKTRELLAEELARQAYKGGRGICYSVSSTHPNSDAYKEYGTNMHAALKFLYWAAVRNVLEHTEQAPLIVLDGNIKFPEIPHSLGESISLPKADALVQHVSAASVIAKVARDAYMTTLGRKYPEYNWAKNKGYPSAEHLAALKKYGYCDEHRKSYEPIKSMIKC